MRPLQLPLHTDRLVLRLHEEPDAAWMHRVYSRPDVNRYLPGPPWTPEMAREKNRERMARTGLEGESGALGLVLEYQGTPFGAVSLWFTDRSGGKAEIGWTMDPDYGGKGFASEAVAAVLKAAFEHYQVRRVIARMDARNTASARLAGRAGMQQEACLRADWWDKGEWTNTLIFGLLASDRA